MIHPVFPVTLLVLPAPLMLAVNEPPTGFAGQVTIRERIVVRVPRMPMASVARPVPTKPIRWKEHKGPKCVSSTELAAAAITRPATIDFIMADGRRMRAKLDRDCRSADFYSGLYIRPGADGRICSDRDAIRVRSGARCEIDNFKLLTAQR